MEEKKYLKAPKIRGVKVPHYKLTENEETKPLLKPKKVTLVMSQHIGAPATVCVEKGEQVFVGTRVGAANGFISADVHSSVSGKVTNIVTVLTPQGQHIQAVEVESDGEFKIDPSITPPTVTDAESLVAAIARSGLVGLGGAGFPTNVKLAVPKGVEVDTLVINGAECEPYITSDYREMMENPDDIVEGIIRVKKLLGLKRAIVGIESNKPEAIMLLREKSNGEFEVMSLKSSYPQGAEKTLIANTTGRAVKTGKLPSDAGVVILNIGTASFIARYLRTGVPLVSKRLTVSGDGIKNGSNVFVPVGTPVKEVVEACGGYTGEIEKLLMGGPMMGIALYSDEYPIVKNNNAILALTKASAPVTENNPCMRCGRCVDTCPMLLSPAEIQVAYETDNVDALIKYGVNSCMECGCCTFVCPAKRPITQVMRLSKLKIRKAANK